MQDRPRELLAASGLTHEEWAQRLPAFSAAYAALYPPDTIAAGKPRQRRVGAGAQGVLAQMTDKRRFMWVYHKTQALQTLHGLPVDLSPPQAHSGIHHLLPVLQCALAALGHAPEHNASRVVASPLAGEATPALALEDPERRRPRPQDPVRQKAYDSGKKRAPTDKHLGWVNGATGKGV